MKKLLLAAAALMFTATACPVDPPATNWAACPTAAAGQVQVAIVTEGVPNAAHEVVCVVVPTGSNSIQALQARAVRLGTETPRLAFGGTFVCSIDGNPAPPECADGAGPPWASWNYSNGGATWTPSTVGSAAHIVTQGSVDGWDFGSWSYSGTDFPVGPLHHASTFSALTGG